MIELNAPNPESLQILLVEDNRINQMVASRLLEKMGHTVTIADNGQKAVEWIAQNKADLIFMDLQMPVMDGLTAAKEIRKWEALQELNPIPIIAATANTSEEDKNNAFAAGMNDFLSKPLRGETIKAAIVRQMQTA
ncbi:MAG: response regulator [Bacteroidota bacterium]